MASASNVSRLEELKEKLTTYEHVEFFDAIIGKVKHPCHKPRCEKIKQAEKWLDWARQRRHLKVVTADVPPGILPTGHHGQLHDVKVFTRYGPDDPIYDNNTDIREKVARGNCFLEIHEGSGSSIECVTYALKKFTGGLGDDDDRDQGDNFTWKKYFTKPLEEARMVVATKKANGEAGHLSVRKYNGQYLIFTGSKNVHMLICDRDDIDKYTEDRFTFAREVSSAIMDLLEGMTQNHRQRVLDFLSQTEYTGVFELLNPKHQHVENLSHMKKPEVRFITWTACDLEPSHDAQLCTMPPHVAIDLARALQLPTVEYELLMTSDVDARMRQIREGYSYEGEVLYFLDASDAVIGLLKKKTIWYIICRAIREKARQACQQYVKGSGKFSKCKSLKKVEGRLDDIQKWLGLDDESINNWKELGCKFITWCISEIDQRRLNFCDVADMFPVAWKRYLEDTGVSDKVLATWVEPEGSDK